MYIKVRVTAGAKKELFEQVSNDHFKISVKEKAQMNMANKRVTALLAECFQVSEKQVRLINGHHSPGKIFDIKD